MNENLELRKEVLHYALMLEDTVTSLIKCYFFIDKEKLKGLSHKGGSLSFKNKIDLLNDFDIINDAEYNSLLKLMEFRNQFMHNIHCNSFTNAVNLLGHDKGKYLLSFLENNEKAFALEEQYISGFRNCFLDIQNKVIGKFKNKMEDIEFKASVLKGYNEKIIHLIDAYGDFLSKLILQITTILIQNKVDQKTSGEIFKAFEENLEDIKLDDPNTKQIEIDIEKVKQMLK